MKDALDILFQNHISHPIKNDLSPARCQKPDRDNLPESMGIILITRFMK